MAGSIRPAREVLIAESWSRGRDLVGDRVLGIGLYKGTLIIEHLFRS